MMWIRPLRQRRNWPYACVRRVTLNALDEGREKAFALESGVSLRMARPEARQAREKLALLMGVANPEVLILPDQLPPLPDSVSEAPSDALMKERLDILAVRAETDALARSLRLGKATRVVIGCAGQFIDGVTDGMASPCGLNRPCLMPGFPVSMKPTFIIVVLWRWLCNRNGDSHRPTSLKLGNLQKPIAMN